MNAHETDESLIYDIAEDPTKPVNAYMVANGETLSSTTGLTDTTAYTLYIDSNGGVIAPEDFSNYFNGFTNLKAIEGLEYLIQVIRLI